MVTDGFKGISLWRHGDICTEGWDGHNNFLIESHHNTGWPRKLVGSGYTIFKCPVHADFQTALDYIPSCISIKFGEWTKTVQII